MDVSFLVGAYNCERTIEWSISSLISQDFKGRYEIVVVDDGSSDRTGELLDRMSKGFDQLRVLHLPENIGLTRALNVGLAACRGRFIARHDADDFSLPHRLTEQFASARGGQEQFLVSRYLVRKQHGVEVERPWYYARSVSQYSLRFGNFLCHGTFFISRNLIENVGGYNQEWRVGQDFELVLRCLRKGFIITTMSRPLYVFTRSEGSISAARSAEQLEMARKALKLHYTDRYFTGWPTRRQRLLRALESLFPLRST